MTHREDVVSTREGHWLLFIFQLSSLIQASKRPKDSLPVPTALTGARLVSAIVALPFR